MKRLAITTDIATTASIPNVSKDFHITSVLKKFQTPNIEMPDKIATLMINILEARLCIDFI